MYVPVAIRWRLWRRDANLKACPPRRVWPAKGYHDNALYDADLPGFGIKVTPAGAQSWIIEYRPGAGGRGVAKRRIVIGSPATLPPEHAREAAERLLAGVKL